MQGSFGAAPGSLTTPFGHVHSPAVQISLTAQTFPPQLGEQHSPTALH